MSNYLRYYLSFLILAQLSVGCKNSDNNKSLSNKTSDSVSSRAAAKEDSTTSKISAPVAFDPASVNDALAEKIKILLVNDYLKADSAVIDTIDRKFNLYQADLNNDGRNETFVNFFTPYFCGTGGCTLLLLDSDLKVITRFTVTETPLYIDFSYKNNWMVLFVKSGGQWRSLTFKDGKYPSNPSVVKNSVTGPSDNAKVVFSDLQRTKVYDF